MKRKLSWNELVRGERRVLRWKIWKRLEYGTECVTC